MLTHVNYRSGRMHDMAETTRAAHAAGALVVWDLAHSAGAVPVDLHGADADFAVGCGYKYLNGGPGAPAFVWAHPRHTARMDREGLRQPLSGWLGHAAPFEFAPRYRPASGHRALRLRHAAGARDGARSSAALDVFADAEAARRHRRRCARKSIALDRALHRAGRGALRRPRPRARHAARRRRARQPGRASPTPTATAVMQALIERGVIGDFRAGERRGARATRARADLLRFGFTPLYTRFVDAWDAAEQLHDVLASGAWRDERFGRRATVT